MLRRILILPLILTLAGCGIPDLVAHTVKEVEKSQRDGSAKPKSSDSQPSAAASRSEEEAPPPVAAPMPRRGSVTAEELPAR